ncbi:MAG: calcium-transporting P-type ATPase, PMR1-type [Firmicutes bacterium]|nr:calcium-transporting P-type ATPase, PMR1-type [Bacillota bacterium]
MNSENAYKKDTTELLIDYDVDKNTGLSLEEVEKRKNLHGLNKLKTQEGESLLKKFFNQFKDFMVIILIIAAIISGSLGEFKDSIIILIVVILNAILGLVQEDKAEKSLQALKNMTTPLAKVLRNNKITQIKSTEIVPGDIVILESGDYIPADGRLLDSSSLKVEESALTGESLPVNKNTEVLQGDNVPLGDRKNMVFSTSMVTHGRGKILVTDTGMKTEIGKIAELIGSQEKLKTPLQIKLEELGKWLGIIALSVCIIIFLIGYMQGRDPLEMFMLAVSLAVAAIPEGLPAIVTIVLSLGVQRMIKRNAIIRRLPAVETLGTASVICSDKTGTLTQNKMTVTKLYTYNDLKDVEKINIENQSSNLAIKIGLLCNDSTINEEKGEKEAIGDPTEVALVVLAQKKGLFKKELERKLERVNEIPFDSERKLMTTIHKSESGYKVFTKGAPDVLLERCNRILDDNTVRDITDDDKKNILSINETMANKALRVLAMAYDDSDSSIDNPTSENTENDLIFVGLSGMIDPPREEVKKAVAKSKSAGIRPVMITGDYKLTAVTIAKELGILDENGKGIDGNELDKLSDEELTEQVDKYSVYARVSPEHKVRIVKAWQNRGKIVAMTGDGVNDAPSLKRSNIGCAMGITGTDVSKEASDMILTDDNFSTIVSAVEEGRNIYANIRKSIHYLLSCNIGEIIALFVALVFNMPSPLIPIHILWINLVTDSFPALSLGVDPAEPGIMDRKPRDPNESIFANGLGLSIGIKGLIIGGVTVLSFITGNNISLETGRTMAFLTLSFSQFGNSLSVRSLDKSLFKIGIFKNKYLIGAILLSSTLMLSVLFIPFLRNVFDLELLSLRETLYVVGFSAIPLISGEIFKKIKSIFKK